MSNLIDIIYYTCQKYPHKDELSKARLTKMVYLSDWKSCLVNNCQLTKIDWFFDNYGPFVDDVHQEIKKYPNLIEIVHTSNYYGYDKTLYVITKNDYVPNLTKTEESIIDEVIEKTQTMHWDSCINFIYSTYPIATSPRYSKLNLLEKSLEYKNNSKWTYIEDCF